MSLSECRQIHNILYNIRRISPFPTHKVAQVLVEAVVISHLDYCNSPLAGVPACGIQTLQFIQNAAAQLVFNLLSSPTLHRSFTPCTGYWCRFKTLALACRTADCSHPSYLQDIVKPYTAAGPSRFCQFFMHEVTYLSYLPLPVISYSK